MLPSSMADLKDRTSGGGGKQIKKVRFSMVRILWRLAVCARSSRNLLAIFKIIIIIGASATALLYYISLDWPVLVEDKSYGFAAEVGRQKRYVIEAQQCSDVTMNCYAVYDTVDMFTGDVNRYLVMQDFQNDHETVVRLIPPAGIRSKESDSRFWQVNHTHITTQYVAVMLTAPFAVSALALSEGASLTANILIIGLGGGSMNMFLTSLFPKTTVTVVELDPVVIDLAKRWFGMDKMHETVHIITMDGIEFVEQAAAREAIFDVVLIDACAKEGDLACPTQSFIQPHFIKNLKKILEPTGVVVLNVLPLDDVMDVVDEAVLIYRKQFPTCAVSRLYREMNTVLTCQLMQQVDPHTSQRLMSQRFQNVWHHFGFSRQFGVMEMSFANSEVRQGSNT